MKNRVLVAALAAFGVAGAASAAPIVAGTQIGIDFGDNVGGPSGGFNAYGTGNPGIAAGSVLDTNGTVVDGVSVITSPFSFANGDPTPSAGQLAELGALGFVEGQLTDFSGGAGFVVFLGLDPSLTYTVEVISLFNGRDLGNTAVLQRDAGSGVTIDTTANLAIATFNNVSLITNDANEPNSINIELQTGDVAVYNAIRVTAEVPEPGSLALLGLGGLAMLRRRRA